MYSDPAGERLSAIAGTAIKVDAADEEDVSDEFVDEEISSCASLDPLLMSMSSASPWCPTTTADNLFEVRFGVE